MLRWLLYRGATTRHAGMAMKVSYDLRFAHLPCGSWPYVSQVIEIMVRQYPQTAWKIYHNPSSKPQQEIVRRLKSLYGNADDGRQLSYQPVKCNCLSLAHHVEFLRFKDDSDVYHYLHFDMPLGMRKIPLVFTVHDLYPLVLPEYCSELKKKFFRYICQENARRAAGVITVSQNTKKDILEHLDIPEEKITVIPQGYSTGFRPIDDVDALKGIAEKYQLPQSFLLYTGNHKPHKNLARLFQAYAILPAALRQEMHLVLTGPITADTENLRQLAMKLGIDRQIKFIGLIDPDDLPGLYNLACLLVLPSLYEGFGLPPLEAMACGKPVVCARAGALPEVVGSAGRLFDPYDVDDIASVLTEAIDKDINDPLRRNMLLGRAAEFGWEKTAQKTYQLYEEIALERMNNE